MAILYFKGKPVITKADAENAENYITELVIKRLNSTLAAMDRRSGNRHTSYMEELISVGTKLLEDSSAPTPSAKYQYATIREVSAEVGWNDSGKSKGAYVPTVVAVIKRLEQLIPDPPAGGGSKKPFMVMEGTESGNIKIEVWGGNVTKIPSLRRAFEVRKGLK